MPPARQLLLIDDDLLSREVLTAVAEEAGFSVQGFEAGEAALAHLALHREQPASVMLVDMQMPGLHGSPLAERLRSFAAPATLLIAMSGSPVAEPALTAFDRFLLKPFSFAEFLAAVDDAPHHAPVPPVATQVLSESTYNSLSHAMAATQLHDLYMLCLDDADRRMRLLREAAAAGDEDAFRRGAHSIMGGCGMVGALEMAALAAAMEDHGPPPIDNLGALDQMVAQFFHASARLRAMLEARPEQAAPTR